MKQKLKEKVRRLRGQTSLLLDNIALTSCALIIIIGHLVREQFKSKKSKR